MKSSLECRVVLSNGSPFNPIALRKPKIAYNFGLSECNTVKFGQNLASSWTGTRDIVIHSWERQLL